MEEQSYIGLLHGVAGGGFEEYWIQSEMMRCAQGNQKLATRLEDGIKNKNNNVTKNTFIKKIEYRPKPDKFVVNDKEYDYVVLAIPPSQLKSIEILGLEKQELNNYEILKQQILKNYGPALKSHVRVRSRFWLKEKKAPNILSDRIGSVWESSDNQMSRDVGLSFFCGLNVDTSKYKSNIEEECEAFFGSSDINKEKIDTTDWSIERYINCGYSCPKLGSFDRNFNLFDSLEKPIGKKLFLVGEYTSKEFFGYMEGALESGFRVAKKIESDENIEAIVTFTKLCQDADEKFNSKSYNECLQSNKEILNILLTVKQISNEDKDVLRSLLRSNNAVCYDKIRNYKKSSIEITEAVKGLEEFIQNKEIFERYYRVVEVVFRNFEIMSVVYGSDERLSIEEKNSMQATMEKMKPTINVRSKEINQKIDSLVAIVLSDLYS